MKKKVILDLCSGTGSWSIPYQKDDNYRVIQVTLPENDVRTYQLEDEVYGILAAPPCVMFSYARTKAKTDRDLREGMECVRACLNIIWSCMEVVQDTAKRTVPLKFWALENPNGLLKHFLGKPAFEFDPCDFGDLYKKHTYLWGWFNNPKKNPVELSEKQKDLYKRSCQPLPKFDAMGSKDIHPEMFGKLTKQARRAITPKGFAEAFYESNK